MPENRIVYLCNITSDTERDRFYVADSAIKKIRAYKEILENNGVEVETLSLSAPRKTFFQHHWQFIIDKTGNIGYYILRLLFESSRLIKYMVYLVLNSKNYVVILSYSYATQNVLLCCFGYCFLGKKIILDYEDGLFSHRTRCQYYSFLEKIILKISSGCILVNEGLRRRLPASKPAVIINGVFMSQKQPVNFKRKPIEGKIVLLYSGELNFDYGLALLFKAFLSEDAQAIDFHITGRGKDEKSLVNFIIEHALQNVTFHGYISSTILNNLEEQADGFILFQNEDSPIYTTNFPSKLFHYLSFGKPVFFNQCSLFAEYKKFTNGIPIVDIENSAREILNILNNRSRHFPQIASEMEAHNNDSLRKLKKVLFEC